MFSSPERRFKSISPCRRLFEELSTNQNSPSPSGFVVSNGNLATPNSSFSNNYSNNNNNNCNSFFNNSDVLVTKSILSNSNLETATTTTKQQVVEGLTDILYSSYQRRRSISGNGNNINNSSYINLLNQSSPFMDDLGFLSTTSTMKKNSLVIYENDGDIINDAEEEENTLVLMSSPMKIKEIPMKSCSIRKHWNRKTTTTSSQRRSMSENFISYTNPKMSENGLIHHLPCFDSPHDAIKRISPDTLVDLLEGKYCGIYEQVHVIDCRYPYEYEGGHIPSAINVNSPDVIEKLLLAEPKQNTLIVFHCEFSSERAPRMALHVRNLDRQMNKTNYPSLYYPEMYILDGGYKNYWQQHGDKCEPTNSYLPMRNPQYRDQLKHYQKMKHAFKSGCHLSQHSTTIKTLPPKSKKPRSKSLNVANARKFFNDLISSGNCEERDGDNSNSFSVDGCTSQNHMFPSYTIPMTNSFSSIFASELDIPSEMDLE